MISELRVYETGNINPYKNLAIEEFLTFHVEPSECILFLWQNQKTVVIGKNQNAWKECNVRQLEKDGGHLVRRLSGGGAVFHDLGNLNFTFCVREEDYDVARQTEVILQAVRFLGIDAEKNGRNDLTVDGRKFSGHAYYKSKGFCYHHGTLLVDVDQMQMAKYLNASAAKLQSKGVDSVRSRTVNLKELRSDLTIAQMKEALIWAFEQVYRTDGARDSADCREDGKKRGNFAGRQFAEDTEKSEKLLISSRNKSGSCGKNEEMNEGMKRIPEDCLDWVWVAEAEQRFDSWEWNYGRKIHFDSSMEQRFSWGGIEIQLHVSGGRIQDVQVYSDAMEQQLPERLQAIWCNCEYRLESMLARLEKLRLDSVNSNEVQIREDIKNLLTQHL